MKRIAERQIQREDGDDPHSVAAETADDSEATVCKCARTLTQAPVESQPRVIRGLPKRRGARAAAPGMPATAPAQSSPSASPFSGVQLSKPASPFAGVQLSKPASPLAGVQLNKPDLPSTHAPDKNASTASLGAPASPLTSVQLNMSAPHTEPAALAAPKAELAKTSTPAPYEYYRDLRGLNWSLAKRMLCIFNESAELANMHAALEEFARVYDEHHTSISVKWLKTPLRKVEKTTSSTAQVESHSAVESLRTAVNKAQADLAKARADADLARAQVDKAKAEADRAVAEAQVAADKAQAAARAELDKAKADARAARTAEAEARTEVERLQVDVRKAQADALKARSDVSDAKASAAQTIVDTEAKARADVEAAWAEAETKAREEVEAKADTDAKDKTEEDAKAMAEIGKESNVPTMDAIPSTPSMAPPMPPAGGFSFAGKPTNSFLSDIQLPSAPKDAKPPTFTLPAGGFSFGATPTVSTKRESGPQASALALNGAAPVPDNATHTKTGDEDGDDNASASSSAQSTSATPSGELKAGPTFAIPSGGFAFGGKPMGSLLKDTKLAAPLNKQTPPTFTAPANPLFGKPLDTMEREEPAAPVTPKSVETTRPITFGSASPRSGVSFGTPSPLAPHRFSFGTSSKTEVSPSFTKTAIGPSFANTSGVTAGAFRFGTTPISFGVEDKESDPEANAQPSSESSAQKSEKPEEAVSEAAANAPAETPRPLRRTRRHRK